MKSFFTFILLSFTLNVSAEVAPEHVEIMLAQMVRENFISPIEAEKTRLRMKSMNSEQWSQINKKASIVAARMTASEVPAQNKNEEVKNIDLDGAQFKAIQSEIKMIMPEFKEVD